MQIIADDNKREERNRVAREWRARRKREGTQPDYMTHRGRAEKSSDADAALKKAQKKRRKKYKLEKPWYHLIHDARRRARFKGINYDLTSEWAEARWIGHCELTGIPFQCLFGSRNLFSPSIDRVVPSKGYTQGNCRFILAGVNYFKNTGTDEDIYKIAEALIMNRRIKPRVSS